MASYREISIAIACLPCVASEADITGAIALEVNNIKLCIYMCVCVRHKPIISPVDPSYEYRTVLQYDSVSPYAPECSRPRLWEHGRPQQSFRGT